LEAEDAVDCWPPICGSGIASVVKRGEAIIVEHDGEPRSLCELADLAGLARSTVSRRYRKGLRGAALIAPADPKRVHRGKWE
jgi:hypothetical protein